MFKQNSIGRRIKAVIDTKIAQLQKEHDERCDEIDRQAFQSKSDHADALVNSVVANFLN